MAWDVRDKPQRDHDVGICEVAQRELLVHSQGEWFAINDKADSGSIIAQNLRMARNDARF